MMNTNGLYTFTNSLSHNVSDWAVYAYHETGKLVGRAIQYFQTIPNHMRADPNVAVGAFLAVNTLAFALFHTVAKNLSTERIENPGHEGKSLDEIRYARTVQKILISGGVGAGLYAANALFVKYTHYPVSRMILAGIVAAEVALHAFLLYFRKKEDGTTIPPQAQQQVNGANPGPVDNRSEDTNPPPAGNEPTKQQGQLVSSDAKEQPPVTQAQQTLPQDNQQTQETESKDQKTTVQEENKKDPQTSSSGTADPQSAQTDQGNPPQQQQGSNNVVSGSGTADSSSTAQPLSFEDKLKQMVKQAQDKITNQAAPLTSDELDNAGHILVEAVPYAYQDTQKKQEAINKREVFLAKNQEFENAKAKRKKLIDTECENEEQLRAAIQEYEEKEQEYIVAARKAIEVFPFDHSKIETVSSEV